MGRKCSVEGCLSDSTRPGHAGVTFHKVPMHANLRPKWMSLCRIPEEKKSHKVIHVCSRHFLRLDFCNFKGKKYMLKQGIYPSVFPWDKSKLEALKAETIKSEDAIGTPASTSTLEQKIEHHEIKSEIQTEENVNGKTEVLHTTSEGESQPNEEVYTELKKPEMKIEDQIDINPEQMLEINPDIQAEPTTNIGNIDFSINSHIEALDFNNMWYPAKIVEIDDQEKEVLIHFDGYSNKYDEWICMTSPRLRPVQLLDQKLLVSSLPLQIYEVGEKCFAFWTDTKKFPATVTRVLEDDFYEVLFDDGYVASLKYDKMVKLHGKGKPPQASPLFDPVQGTKQDRRDKKRKINVAALFGKRQKLEGEIKTRTPSPKASKQQQVQEAAALSADEEFEPWVVRWHHGRPVGVDSSIETQDGVKKTVIVPDPRLPEGWSKHLLQRTHGASLGKWDTVIVSPSMKRFRSRTDIKKYLDDEKSIPYDENVFDFRLYRQKPRKSLSGVTPLDSRRSSEAKIVENLAALAEELSEIKEEEVNPNLLKIPIVDDAYKCPIEGCGKNFRKENLAQMHVKHYHPEYTKFLDSTPNVADLAYARTVGESLDKSPVTPKAPAAKPKTSTPKAAPKQPQPAPDFDLNTEIPICFKGKDQEIIKLLTSKFDSKQDSEQIEPLPSGLPSSMYPDIKLKDLLNKSEGIPNKDEINFKSLINSRPIGIKTILPVVRNDNRSEDVANQVETKSHRGNKSGKRRKTQEHHVTGRGRLIKAIPDEVPTAPVRTPTPPPPVEEPIEEQPEPRQFIIENNRIIKIVRMKQEEIINCTCGFMEEDGLMIQCELCLCWQHAYCNNIERESQVPDKYVCYICQNPLRQRSSRKYFHDQDWLKQGALPVASYHTRDEEVLQKRFEKLKKSHDLSGGLHELNDFVHTLNVKLKIAEAKDHPKLYLWSKPWEKLPLPEKQHLSDKLSADHEKGESILALLKDDQGPSTGESFKSDPTNPGTQVPIIPQPEAAIETADCRLNLLDHILHSQHLVMERLDDFENAMDVLEEGVPLEREQDCPRTRQTLQMLMRDLNKLEELSHNTSI